MRDSRTTKFKVGDRVKLVNKIDHDFGWNRDLKIGKTYKVTQAPDIESLGKCFIRIFVSKSYQAWALPVSCFAKVEEQLLFDFMYE